jgi:hypothetical protein
MGKVDKKANRFL